jgi:hypothetical protein
MMVGGAIGGIVGVYLSVPFVAMLRVFWRRFCPCRSTCSCTYLPMTPR